MSLLATLAGPITNIVSQFVTDKDKMNELESQIKAVILDNESQIVSAQRDVLVTEINKSDLSAMWRPHLMYLLMGLMIFNGVIVPLISGIWGYELPVLEAWQSMPTEMWTLIQISLGGYIIGRSGEKMMTGYLNR